MPRTSKKSDDLATIEARRDALREELAQLDERARLAELAARDAGRPVLIAALERIKIAAMDKSDAKAIAAAIGQHGGRFVADRLAAAATS